MLITNFTLATGMFTPLTATVCEYFTVQELCDRFHGIVEQHEEYQFGTAAPGCQHQSAGSRQDGALQGNDRSR